jgi:putative tricarboxylic transport membrane protein
MTARSALAAVTACCTIAISPAALAQTAPWKPARNVEIVVGVGPGGGIDRTARLIQKILQDQKLLDVTATVVNKPGGGGTIAQAQLNQRQGDAHVWEITATSLLTNHITGRSALGHKDFTPIAMLSDEYIGFLVRADSPLANGRDLLDRLRTDPGSLPIGIATAAGNTNHIAAGLVAKAAGADVKQLKVVVYGSGGESMTSLLGGHVGLVVTPSANAVNHLRSGKMRVLAVASPTRLEGALAVVPTWKEQQADVIVANWRPAIGPRGWSATQVAFWEDALAQVTRSEEWKSSVAQSGAVTHYMNGRELGAFFDAQYAQFRTILTELGLAKQP